MNNDNTNAARQLLGAIKQNDIATASSLISSRASNLNSNPWPLHLAAEEGRVEIITILLDAGADINAVDERQRTACDVAIFCDQFDALKMLVERGANLGVAGSDGRSLLSSVALYCRSERYVILLLDAGAPLDGVKPYILLTLVRSVAVLERFSARGFNLPTIRDDNDGMLCHHVAWSVTREDDLRLLFGVCGNATNAVDKSGEIPLHWAASSGNESALRILVELGADVDRQGHDGWTALHYASSGQDQTLSIVELLLALGADARLVDKSGQTACVVGRPELVALCPLVAAGSDFDHQDNDGNTPRNIAVEWGHPLPTADEIDAARRRIAKRRLDLVRSRALEICVGLQHLNLAALELCNILMHSFGAIGALITFHQWWAFATKVKHFHTRCTYL
jgi:ankyrin repeat protein